MAEVECIILIDGEQFECHLEGKGGVEALLAWKGEGS